MRSRVITFVFVISLVFTIPMTFDESMNLSFVIVIVQDKSLAIPKVKEICNKWKLCYYYKLQHSSKTTKEYFNKKLFALYFVDLDNIVNVDEDVSLLARKV